VRPYSGRYGDLDIDTLFWGALIVLALFLSCFLAWRAIKWLRNPTKTVVRPRPQPTVLTAEREQTTEPYVPDTKPFVPQGFGRTLGDGSSLSHMTDMAGFCEWEGEFLQIYGPRKMRHALMSASRWPSSAGSTPARLWAGYPWPIPCPLSAVFHVL
jgi:hypothetical protein